ncbi:MAG: tRNA (N6-threonylcarbamoyladenosine(37)-N6)-methyltransferase TrmO [Desulfococcaceae bacterium]|jgi:tRNA-Thr(GGU) m(6)t(6)A37 methyltransferase TsaA|nr:tRNA (N6-threonylcarbamoyladenosine(37)-N6)-methyltransferase TrmO [Desulfococcaceae bacterium]
MKTKYEIYPIGWIKKSNDSSVIELEEEYLEALDGAQDFSHLIVLYWFHENDRPELRKTMKVHPRKNKNNPLTGIFATHSPLRPNLIALCYCKVLQIEGNRIYIDEIDAYDGSPVIDIKAYIPIDKLAKDEIRLPGWV